MINLQLVIGPAIVDAWLTASSELSAAMALVQTGVVFESSDKGRTWQRGPDSGYPLRRVSVVHGRLVGATPFDGVIVQPENESQSAAAGSGGGNN